MSKFQSLYRKLNKEQKEAVDTIDGPVMIIAGPGTGKTMTLTTRIANILKRTDTDPGSILALTFTDSGAKEMRKRLLEIIGPTAYYVNIYTFHSLCTDIIKEFPEIFLISEDASPLSELERIQIFREIIDSSNLEILRSTNAPYFYLHEIIKKIKNLKRENITPKQLENLIKKEHEKLKSVSKKEKINPRTGRAYTKFDQLEKKIFKNRDLAKIYQKYQKKLAEINRFDFEDMINLVVEKLTSDKNFKLTLQERYLYILVDEYQDTNSAQNQIIRLLTDMWENPNIFVVGDDEQSIYRFQGASIENVLYFQNLFKKAKIITLISNYRSSQYILNASRSLIQKNLLKLEGIDKNLKSKLRRANIPISIGSFSNASVENKFIAKEIKKIIKKGTDPDEIAILVRNNRDIDDIKDALSRENIRFEIASGKNVLEDGDINRLFTLFTVISDLKNSPSDDIAFFTVLNYEFLNFNKLDILKLSRLASKERINLTEAIITEDIFSKSNLTEPEKFIGFVNKLNSWQNLAANSTFTKFFEVVLHESGFLHWILSDKYNISRINTINTLFDEVKKLNFADHTLSLEKFLENIELMRENNIKIEEEPLGTDTQAVKLLTAHKAKGLEFEYVFIVKCIDKKWGNATHRDLIKLPDGIIQNVDITQKEKNEDERRLFYVALTRAKKKVYITYADEYATSGYKREAVPSMFLSEIDEKFLEKIDTNEFEKNYIQQISKQLKLPESEKSKLSEEDFLNNLIANYKMSVTDLNTYLKCPYKFKLNNILRTPRAKAPHLAFGTAVHKSLEAFFKKFKNIHRLSTKNSLLSEFKKALEKEIFTDTDFKAMLARGNKALTEYYDKNKDLFVEPLFTEYSFGFRKVYLNDIPLAGKIDKVEWADRDKKQVKVIDYKTGAPKSRGEIEGKTKYSDGDLLRQLLFYRLLSQLDYNFNYEAVKGEFIFLESKGYKQAKNESYAYSPEQIEDLKTLIRETMEKIRNHKFGKTKEYRHCQYCDYQNHCWADGIPQN